MDSEENIKAVQRMQDYIGSHLDAPITLRDLSFAAGYSQYYCMRIFKEHTGYTPFDYIRMSRLTEAARELRDRKPRVIDVALDFVFDSHEGFTRAFTKEFGISPRKYRDNPVPLEYFIPYSVLIRYLYKKKKEDISMAKAKTKTVFTQVIERPARKAIIKRGIKAEEYFAYCKEVGCGIMGVLESVKEALYEPAGFWLPEKLVKAGTSVYVQGVEVPENYCGAVPAGYDVIELEPFKFMVFQGEPYEDENFEEAINEVWDCIDKYNPKIYGYEWAVKDAPRFQLAPQGYRGYIEARPVKALLKK